MYNCYFRRICDCWAVISTDLTFTCDILDNFKNILKNSPPYEKQENGDTSKTVGAQPLQVSFCRYDYKIAKTNLVYRFKLCICHKYGLINASKVT